MSREGTTLPAPAQVVPAPARAFTLDARYLAPILITLILVVSHLTFGILEGYSRTGLAIATAIIAEAVMGRVTHGRWPHLASAYVTGISVGMLVRSPFLWPYLLGSLISITTKYVFRLKGRHLWNPSNFGVSAVLFLAPAASSVLSIQWGNAIWPMLIIWLLGLVIVWRVGRLHITLTYVASFMVLSWIRGVLTGTPWLAAVAPLTGPMYQLYVFFMITDPRTTVGPRWAQAVVVFLVALVEMVLRLNEVIYAPFYALFVVGPMAMLVESWWESRKPRAAAWAS
jgi:Na+-translocating ferredoxin:NAD+ oxidoreductase RnfD subunit